MKIRVGQYGARMYYGIPRALESVGLLEKLYTDFTVNKGLPRILAQWPRFSKIKNRMVHDLPAGKIIHLPDYGIRHMMRMKRAKDENAVNEANFRHGEYLERQMMRDGLSGVDAICMVGSPSELIFKHARKKGIITIEEQIIAPAATYLSILETYLKPYESWEDVKTSITSIYYWQDVSEREWAVCDYLLSGSEFVTASVIKCGYNPKKIVTIPYGVPVLQGATSFVREFSGNGKLKVLFAGTVGIRKGIQYLLEIAKDVKDFCDIKICGAIALRQEIVDRYKGDVTFVGHVSRERMNEYYAWADVFVLPTLFEGSATVCYEAIQHALPVITTRNSGIFLNDDEGIILISEGDSDSLRKALIYYYEHPSEIRRHSEILKSKIEFASMEGYQSRLKYFFQKLTSKTK